MLLTGNARNKNDTEYAPIIRFIEYPVKTYERDNINIRSVAIFAYSCAIDCATIIC